MIGIFVRQGNLRRGAGPFLALSVLLVSSFAEKAAVEPKSTVPESVPRLSRPEPASNPLLKTGGHQETSPVRAAREQDDAGQRSKDLAVHSQKLIGLEQPLPDFSQRDFAEVEHTWSGGDNQPTWTGGAIESLPSSFEGAPFNFTTSLSGALEVVLPFGGGVAKEMSESELRIEFRVFGSLTMKF